MHQYRKVDYNTWKRRERTYTPHVGIGDKITIAEIEKFCNKIVKTEKCWIFKSKSQQAYIRFATVSGLYLVHRLAYELFNRPIAPGLTIDHLCRNGHCVNPKHLEAVTVVENSTRYRRFQRYGVAAVKEYAI